ncbi:MAG TPA: pilus assembly protein PilB, partial [Verrucomicrobiae bacterium]
MAEEISAPLLSLVKEQGLIDDLQYEEVAGEFKRSGKPIIQILQDFAVMDLDMILQVMANHLSTEVVTLSDRNLTPQVIESIPAKTARMYQCMPVAVDNGALKLALVDPLNPARIDELGFVIKKDIQLVVADPTAIQKAIEKYYPEGGVAADDESFSEILKELGADQELAKEAKIADSGDDSAMQDLANQAPIVRFVNLVLFQAVQDRASDIHFEPFEDEFKIRYRVDGALYEM